MNKSCCLVTLLIIELLIPHARSLKDKRREVRRLKERIRSKFNASVSEVAYQDKWQRAVIAVSLVGSDKSELQANSAKIRSLCQESTDIQITHIKQEWL